MAKVGGGTPGRQEPENVCRKSGDFEHPPTGRARCSRDSLPRSAKRVHAAVALAPVSIYAVVISIRRGACPGVVGRQRRSRCRLDRGPGSPAKVPDPTNQPASSTFCTRPVPGIGRSSWNKQGAGVWRCRQTWAHFPKASPGLDPWGRGGSPAGVPGGSSLGACLAHVGRKHRVTHRTLPCLAFRRQRVRAAGPVMR